MNREIFKLDMEQEEYTINAINEEYDIASIPMKKMQKMNMIFNFYNYFYIIILY